MNNQFFNHALYKSTRDGRFELLRSLHLGQRGGAGGEEYIVVDVFNVNDNDKAKTFHCVSQKMAECYVQLRKFSRECSPWFGSDARDGGVAEYDKEFTVNESEWKDIKDT